MVWESLLDLLGIKRHMTSPYYPQGNALIERMHRTLGNMLRSGLMEQDVDWPTLLPGIMLTLNEMPQGTHGYSATQVMWGQGAKLPVDLVWPGKREVKVELENYVKRVRLSFGKIKLIVTPFNQIETYLSNIHTNRQISANINATL